MMAFEIKKNVIMALDQSKVQNPGKTRKCLTRLEAFFGNIVTRKWTIVKWENAEGRKDVKICKCLSYN